MQNCLNDYLLSLAHPHAGENLAAGTASFGEERGVRGLAPHLQPYTPEHGCPAVWGLQAHFLLDDSHGSEELLESQ